MNSLQILALYQDFPNGLASEESACNARDTGSVPGPGRPPGAGNALYYMKQVSPLFLTPDPAPGPTVYHLHAHKPVLKFGSHTIGNFSKF